MKILHTSDWHIGKRLGRHDRMGEFAEVLAEVEAIADERAVDLVLVSGDIWDRPMPPTDALHLGLQTLLRLAEGRPVVAVAGNHDSPGLFEALAPLLRPLGVFLIGDVEAARRRARSSARMSSACPPSSRASRSCERAAWSTSWPTPASGTARTPSASRHHAHVQRGARDAAGGDAVPILMAHFMVGGVAIDRGAPRGERELHMGDAYAATAAGDPRRARSTSRWAHPCAADGAGRARAGPVRGLAAGAGLRRGRRAEAGRDRRRRTRPARHHREHPAHEAAAP